MKRWIYRPRWVGAAVLLGSIVGPSASGSSPDAPASKIPREMREMWLRFHETELCQNLDAVFAFHDRGVEIWCRVDDEKSFQKLGELVAPLRDAFAVEIYATRPDADNKPTDEKHPPPSFWNNAEIREYLQDPFARNTTSRAVSPASPASGERDSDLFLKQRMVMFAEQTLESGLKMRRYGHDLPDLSQAGFGPGADPELKARAAEAARAHASGVDKQANRLMENLSRALPKSSKRGETTRVQRRRASNVGPDVGAVQLSDAARSVARRVYLFVHPQTHTVGLVDLREPSLLESLRTLERMSEDFLRTSRRSR